MSMVRIPAPETDFIDPRTGKLSKLWYQYFQQFGQETTKVINSVTNTTFLRNSGSFMSNSNDNDPEPGPRGIPGRNGRDGVTKTVYVYLPADENEPMTVYRKLA